MIFANFSSRHDYQKKAIFLQYSDCDLQQLWWRQQVVMIDDKGNNFSKGEDLSFKAEMSNEQKIISGWGDSVSKMLKTFKTYLNYLKK